MRIPIAVLAAALCVCVALAAPAGAVVVKLPAGVKLAACASSVDPAARQATFEGTIRAIPGAMKLRMRFNLQARVSERLRWTPVPADGFGTWVSSDPGVKKYVYTKAVANLAAPAAYRVVTRFRWLDKDGKTIAQRRVVSASCRQPDLRADLAATRVDLQPGPTAETRRYVVFVRNDGRTPSGPFELILSVDGAPQPAQQVPSLVPAERRLVEVIAAPCTPGTGTIGVLLDAGAGVDERDERDNMFKRRCL